MSAPEIENVMARLRAIGKAVIERTARDAADDLRKNLSVPGPSDNVNVGTFEDRRSGRFFDPSVRTVTIGRLSFGREGGGFPHLRSGRLRDSVYYRVVEETADRLFFEIGCSAPHSKFLELGTRLMAARPHLRPTRQKWEPILRQRLIDAYRAAGPNP